MNDTPQEKNIQTSHDAWQAHVLASQQSGLSRAEYCRRHELSYHALTYWCKKSAQSLAGDTASDSICLVPVTLPFSEQAESSDRSSGLHLRFSETITIEVDCGFSQHTLCSLLSVLEQRS